MELEDLRNHLVICGWNPSAHLIAQEMILGDPDAQVVIISEQPMSDDPDFERLASNLHHVQGDFTRIDVLKEARVDRAKIAVLLSDDSEERSDQDQDARSVLAAMLIEKLNHEIYTTVQLHNRDNQLSLKSAGVEEVIVTDEYVGNIMATVVRSHGIVSVLEELLTSQRGHQFYKTTTPIRLVGEPVSIALVRLKEEDDATLIAVECAAEARIIVNPPKDYELKADDQLFVTANKAIS